MDTETDAKLAVVRMAREQLHRWVSGEDGSRVGYSAFERLVELYKGLEEPNERDRCTECEAGGVELVFSTDHVPGCWGHPALRRAWAARDATFLLDPGIEGDRARGKAAEAAVAGIVLPQGVQRPYLSHYEADAVIRRFRDGNPYARSHPKLPEKAAELIEAVCLVCERRLTGLAPPCPFCDDVLPLQQSVDHLWKCESHPGNILAAQLEESLRAAIGPRAEVMLEVVRRRNELRLGLRLLLRATESFDSSMGWDGERSYSEAWSEGPWHAARHRAALLIGYGAARPKPGSGWKSETRQALDRALLRVRQGEAADEKDAALLRKRNAELTRWIAVHGFVVRCPCCHRDGVHAGRIDAHLIECHARPTRVELRAAQAELRFFLADLPLLVYGFRPQLPDPEPAVAMLDPCHPLSDTRKPYPQFESYWHRVQVEALERLLSPAPRLLSDDERRLEDWLQEAQSYPGGGICAACRTFRSEENAMAHQLWCPAHPEVSEIRRLDQELRALRGRFPSPICELVRESERLVSAIAGLLDVGGAFWSRMGDGERGKSTSDRVEDQMLTRGIWEAAAFVAGM